MLSLVNVRLASAIGLLGCFGCGGELVELDLPDEVDAQSLVWSIEDLSNQRPLEFYAHDVSNPFHLPLEADSHISMSVAILNDSLVEVGLPETLRAAVDDEPIFSLESSVLRRQGGVLNNSDFSGWEEFPTNELQTRIPIFDAATLNDPCVAFGLEDYRTKTIELPEQGTEVWNLVGQSDTRAWLILSTGGIVSVDAVGNLGSVTATGALFTAGVSDGGGNLFLARYGGGVDHVRPDGSLIAHYAFDGRVGHARDIDRAGQVLFAMTSTGSFQRFDGQSWTEIAAGRDVPDYVEKRVAAVSEDEAFAVGIEDARIARYLQGQVTSLNPELNDINFEFENVHHHATLGTFVGATDYVMIQASIMYFNPSTQVFEVLEGPAQAFVHGIATLGDGVVFGGGSTGTGVLGLVRRGRTCVRKIGDYVPFHILTIGESILMSGANHPVFGETQRRLQIFIPVEE